jgi:sugar phosphate isomerase/epimerase
LKDGNIRTDTAEMGAERWPAETGRGWAPAIGISGTEFRGAHVAELLRAAVEVGADAVEVWYPENFTAGGVKATCARLAAWAGGIAAVSVGVEVGETADVDGTQGRLIEALAICGQLGASRLNTYFGAPGYRDDLRSGDVFLRNIQPVLRQAERLGVTILLENEFDAFGRDHVRGDLTRRPMALRGLLRRAGSERLKLNFDAANFYCAGVEPFPYAYTILVNDIGYVHVKDVRHANPAVPEAPDEHWCRYRDYDRVYLTTTLGSGAVNWTGLLRQLANDGYHGPLTLEPHAQPAFRAASLADGVTWLRAAVQAITNAVSRPGASIAP